MVNSSTGETGETAGIGGPAVLESISNTLTQEKEDIDALGDSDSGPGTGENTWEGCRASLEPEDLEDGYVISLDVDGPITEHGASMEPFEDYTREEMAGLLGDFVEEVEASGGRLVLNSGKPRAWLEELVEEYADYDDRLDDLDVIGGMGTEFRIDGEEFVENNNGRKELIDTQREIYRLAAEERLKINVQNNQEVNDVLVNRFEAEGNGEATRGETKQNPTARLDKGTKGIYEEYLAEQEGFDLIEYSHSVEVESEYAVTVELEDEGAMDRLIRLQRHDEGFIGLRFEYDEEREEYVFYRDEKDRGFSESGNIRSEEDLEKEVLGTIEEYGNDWETAVHGDGGIEYWDEDACGKGIGMKTYLDRVDQLPEDAASIHLGDSPTSDAYKRDNGYFIPQEGTEAENVEHPRKLPSQGGAGSMIENIIDYRGEA